MLQLPPQTRYSENNSAQCYLFLIIWGGRGYIICQAAFDTKFRVIIFWKYCAIDSAFLYFVLFHFIFFQYNSYMYTIKLQAAEIYEMEWVLQNYTKSNQNKDINIRNTKVLNIIFETEKYQKN